jgi:hypothetical protein
MSIIAFFSTFLFSWIVEQSYGNHYPTSNITLWNLARLKKVPSDILLYVIISL